MKKIERKITIDGKQFTYSFNTFALTKLAQLVRGNPANCIEKIIAIAQRDILETIALMIYAGIIGHEKANGIFFGNTEIQVVSRYVANADFEQFTELWNICKETIGIPEGTQAA